MTAQQFLPHLTAFIEAQEGITSHWNGSDDTYTGPDGETYDEDDAHTAQDRADAAKKLKEEIEQYDL